MASSTRYEARATLQNIVLLIQLTATGYMFPPCRGRSGKQLDVESLERDNDRGLDALSERVGLLKAATHGIKSEVENQHNLLDNMDGSMGHTRGMLGSVNDKFKLVMSNKQNRNMAVTILGVTGIVVLMWWILRR
ncbi:hypothetical protein QJQ45_027688 [Haematococcus lacustris]|nr:hypothetical protein QJQ45_027688 [Haematococcus lacustris]